MKSFEDIMDNIGRLVNKGVMTESQGNIIADSFYDIYMTEANAFNKAVDIYKKKGLPEYKKMSDLVDASTKLNRNDSKRDQYIDAANDKFMDAYEIKSKVGLHGTRYGGLGQFDVDHNLSHRNFSNSRGKYEPDTIRRVNNKYIENKKMWMQDHGNTGVSPEKKYKAGRYLELQKIGQESSLEDEINGLGIACEAGLISEDFLPILLEAVDSYLE